jgi:hypothetical protein
MPNWYRILCFFQIHRRCIKEEDGLHCIDCGHFEDKATVLANMHAGGGW